MFHLKETVLFGCRRLGGSLCRGSGLLGGGSGLAALLRLLGENARQTRRGLLEEHKKRSSELVLAGNLGEGLDHGGVDDLAVVIGALDGSLAGGILNESHDGLGDGGGFTLADDYGRGTGEHRVDVVGPALLLRNLREVGVLDDEKTALDLAEFRAELGKLSDRDTAVVDDEAVVGIFDAGDDFVQNRNLFNSHFKYLLSLFGIRRGDHGNTDTHRGGNAHGLDEGTLDGSGLRGLNGGDDGLDVAHESGIVKAALAGDDGEVACLVHTEIDLAALGFLNGSGGVVGDGARLGVGHEAAGAENSGALADFLHRFNGGDGDVEIAPTFLGDLLDQIGHTDVVGTGLTGRFGRVTAGEHGDLYGLAGTVGELNRTANGGIALREILAEVEINVDSLVELRTGVCLDELDGLLDGNGLLGRLLESGAILLTVLHSTTSIPMLRAVPTIIL